MLSKQLLKQVLLNPHFILILIIIYMLYETSIVKGLLTYLPSFEPYMVHDLGICVFMSLVCEMY